MCRHLSVVVIAAIAASPLFARPVAAQSPNTASIIVTVVDQNGGALKSAKVLVVNTLTGATRDVASGADGSVTVAALPLTGIYTVHVEKAGFTPEDVTTLTLRAGETAVVRIRLLVAGTRNEVTVYGTAEGVRADAQISRRLDSATIDSTPIMGRKLTTLPLFNAAFRQGKGTGDLFVNATYFITASGSRRTTTYMLDGASNDESWGRQTMVSTVPVGAVQEVNVISNAFSAEFGWTAGPALNVVTKSGTNAFRGEGLFMSRPAGLQAKALSTANFCPSSVASCATPSTLVRLTPPDLPDQLAQFSGSLGGPLAKDRTFFFLTADYTRQDRTAPLSDTLPAWVLPSDGSLTYVGHYRQTLVNGRVDHKLSATQTLTGIVNVDRFYDTNPNDAVGGTSAPSVARRYTRGSWRAQVNHTLLVTSNLFNEARLVYADADPVTRWEAQTLSTAYTRSGSVPFTIGQSRLSDVYSRQAQLADTLSWSRGRHYLRFGGSLTRHISGGAGSEPGLAVLGTFTFRSATTAPFEQLTLADVQQYAEPINYGISSYVIRQWMAVAFVQDSWRVRDDLTVDAGLRDDRQTLTDAHGHIAPRVGVGWHPGGSDRLVVRGGYSMYYTQIRANVLASALISGLDGLASYTATSGQVGFPTCLTCVPMNLDPRVLPASQLPARDITILPGRRAFYRNQFAQYGLNFDLLPNYPDRLVNPRSQVETVGVEHQVLKGLFVSADYVHQDWTNLDRTVDLNAPSEFDRTAPGQTRTVAAANATRPILPVNGGVRQVNVVMNLGQARYDGLQTQVSYRGKPNLYLSASYTLSKATNTAEPDGNGIAPNQGALSRLGEVERGPSVVDQRHRAVINVSYRFPWNITAGTVTTLASARPFNATTGVDNNGDGLNNDRPVIDGVVIGKSAFTGTGTQDVSMYLEGTIKTGGRSLVLRFEGFNILNHNNYLGRAQTVYGDTNAASATFGQIVTVGSSAYGLPALANVDPPRMFQLQVRFIF